MTSNSRESSTRVERSGVEGVEVPTFASPPSEDIFAEEVVCYSGSHLLRENIVC